MTAPMTEQRLAEIEARANAATRGPWFAHATDDQMFMNARYVSITPGSFHHDEGNGMAEGWSSQVDSETVVAITLLQSPRLVDPDEMDENTEFIAAARFDVPALVMEVRRLRTALVIAKQHTQIVTVSRGQADDLLFTIRHEIERVLMGGQP